MSEIVRPHRKKTPLALEVNQVHKRFGDNEVLKGISLQAHHGEVISILGSSGSGKSTFLRCINFLEIADQGTFIINGEEIRQTRDRHGKQHPADWKQIERIRSRLGMVFQGFNLWSHRTILENVIEAPVYVLNQDKYEATEKAEELLQKVGLYHKRHEYPPFLSG